MATKVKPTRLQITWTPQAWQVPIYVNPDCFCWGSSGCQWTVIWPSSSCDWDIPLFCGTCWDCIIDSWEKLCDYAKCCDIPTDNCQLANWCWYQTTSCMVNDFSSPSCTTYPTTEAVCCYVWQKIAGAYIYKWTVNTYEDLPTTWLTAWDVYNVTTVHTTSPEFPAWANLAWTWSDWDVLWWLVDLSWKQDVLTAWPNITIASNVISWDFNFATSSTAAACTTKCVCIPEITQLCTWQQITVMPSVTATNCATSLKLNDFTAYPIRYMNAALTSTTDWYVWWANCLATFVFDWSYWHVVSKSYDTNTTYTLNTLLDAWKYTAWTGTYALSRYSLVMEKDDWTWEKITNTSATYSTWTTKTVNTNWFRLNHIRYYNTSTNVATGALIATNTLAKQAASVDLRYSTNCWWTTTFAEWDYIYLVGKMWADWLFYLDTTQWWTNTLPTTNDWKLYIRIWIALAAAWYTASFLTERPIFYYDNWIKIYQQADNKQDVISDLSSIRSWATCGSTSVQPWDLACYAQCCDIPDTSCFQLTCNLVCDLSWADNTHYPSAKAVADAIQCAWGWDMMKSVYDPCWCNDDAFDYCNFHNTPTIPTDNCQLANGCWYTTCTGTLNWWDLKTINWCCLVWSWDICIQWWGWWASNCMEYLVVWWWGWWNWCRAWWWWWAVNHWYIRIANMCIWIWLWWAWANCSLNACYWWNWWCSYMCWDWVAIISNWWCWVTNDCVSWWMSGSWKQWWRRWSSSCRWVWWWWATWFWWNALNVTWQCYAWNWWTWCTLNISWELCWYGWWWWWWQWADCLTDWLWADWWWWWAGSTTSQWLCWHDWVRWWWGGGWCSCCWWNWWDWIVIISYDSSLWCTITWWDCCYECNGRCIHIFTQNWTLTVN